MSAASYEQLVIYSPFQRRLLGLLLALGLISVGAFGILYIGWLFAGFVFVCAASLAFILQPRLALYGIVAVVLVVEATSGLVFLRPLDVIYSGIDDIVGFGPPMSPLEGALSLVVLGAVLDAWKHSRDLRFGQFALPLILLTAVLILSWIRGATSGGDFITGFHELRAMFYLPILYFLSINLIQDRRHLVQLGAVIIIATLVMVVGALFTHFSVVRPGNADNIIDVVFQAHENALFAGLVVMLALSHTIWGKKLRPRLLLGAAGILALAGLLVLKRRLGVLALDAGVLILGLLLIRQNWRLSVIVLPFLIVIAAIYLAVYWNASGGIGQGARSFRTVVGEEPAAEDASSTEYRDLEALNVEQNIRWNPIFGIGFGREYVFVHELPDLTSFWGFQKVIPHNTIYWTWMKGGMPAFALTLALFGYAMMRGAAVARRKMDGLLRAWALTAAASVPMFFLFAWGDLGLTLTRATLIFGVCLGMIAVIDRMTAPSLSPPDAPAADATPGA
jgi:hypothetical protein